MGVGFNYLYQSGADLTRGKYPVVDLGSLLELVQYGTSEKANMNNDGVAVIRMNQGRKWSALIKLSWSAFDLANSLRISLDPALLPLKRLHSETRPRPLVLIKK